MQNRAYSLLQIKSVDEEKRIIRGTATTPDPDRVGDIVEPLGVKFKNPMPLLWQHRTSEPVGNVRFDKPTKEGIEFEAHFAAPTQSKTLIERIDEAWESVKLGLVRAVSIGFKAIEYSFMDDGGIHFQKTEVMELSLVTIPANAQATISAIKSLDAPLLAASGLKLEGLDRPQRPASGKTAVDDRKKDKKMPKTVAEQISAFEATRAAKAARMEAIMAKAAEDGTTLAKEESEEYDTLELELAQIDLHLQRLAKMQKVQLSRAKQAGTEDGEEVATTQKRQVIGGIGHNSGIIAMKEPDVPKGTGFARLAIAMAAGKGDTMRMLARAKEWESSMPYMKDIIEIGPQNLLDGLRTKAAVGVGTTTDATWASPLIAYTVLATEFIELLRPATIIGKITGLRRVPFNIQMPAATTGSAVNWVGENAPKPVTKMDFSTVTLRWAKAAGIIVLTDELVRFSNPAAEAVVRNDLIDAMTQFLDSQFVDPAIAEITNVSPASITNGVSPISRTGTNEAAFRADVKTLFNTFLAANLSTAGGVWIMTQQQALSLSLMINALGQPSFPTITGEGGSLLGYPVIASENVKTMGNSPADGSNLIFAKASDIMLADDGQTVIDASNQASVQMDTAPDSPPTASTTLVSLWQMNMTGVRAERWINWKKRRSTAVAYIQNALYS
jgi:HK97 family phage major capsid protein/HK97 family phage prohead protease